MFKFSFDFFDHFVFEIVFGRSLSNVFGKHSTTWSTLNKQHIDLQNTFIKLFRSLWFIKLFRSLWFIKLFRSLWFVKLIRSFGFFLNYRKYVVFLAVFRFSLFLSLATLYFSSFFIVTLNANLENREVLQLGFKKGLNYPFGGNSINCEK